MSSSDMDTTAVIIAVCVIVPAVIAIGVCVIIYCAHRKKDRKSYRQEDRSRPYEYEQSRGRPPSENYIIDFSRPNRYPEQQQQQQQVRRPRQPPPVFETSPPTYDTTIVQTRRQQGPWLSSGRMARSATNIRRSSPIITPSVYSAMPPSYAEIFLAPDLLPNE